MSLRNWYAALAIGVGLVGLLLDFWVIAGTMVASSANPVARSLPNMLIYYWTFLTNLSNGALILTYLSDTTPWRRLSWFSHPATRTGMAGIMVLVMGFYHFMLAPTLHDLPVAIVISNILLHYCTPVLFLGWWSAFNAHGGLRFRDVPTMLVPGVSYVAYVLLRGLAAGEYPYTILDPTFAIPAHPAQGYFGVAIGVGILVILVVIFDLLLVAIDGLIGRRQQRI
jgi:hypothetical protein